MCATRNKVWAADKRGVFLEDVRRTGNISAAARAANVPRRAVYQLRRDDDDFRQALESATEEALDDLEAELRRRAVDGVERPVFYGGQQCGAIRNYSDRLGMFLLKSRRRQVFCEPAKPGQSDKSDNLPEEFPKESARQKLIKRLDAMGSGQSAQVNEGEPQK